jgi:phage replication O-like protein O
MKIFQRIDKKYFQVNNEVVDVLAKHLTTSEFAILITIIRMTRGWNKRVDYISLSQFVKITPISSINTVRKAIEGLAEKKIILVKTGDHETPSLYALNEDFETSMIEENQEPEPKTDEELYQELLRPVSKTDNTKDIIKNNKNIKHSDKSLDEKSYEDLGFVGLTVKHAKEAERKPIENSILDYPPDVQEIVLQFCKNWNMPAPTSKMPQFSLWIKTAREIKSMLQDTGLTAEQTMKELKYIWSTPTQEWIDRKDYAGRYPVYGIQSIKNTIWEAITNLVTENPARKTKTYIDANGKEIEKEL